jgi:hypothetical protein
MSGQARAWVWLGVVAVALVAGGVYFATELSTHGRLEVTLKNQTGGALTEVAFSSAEPSGEAYLGRIEDGAATSGRIPLTTSPLLSFRGAEGKTRKAKYAFGNTSGVSHRLVITLAQPGKGPEAQRTMRTKTTLLGTNAEYTDSIKAIDDRTLADSQ